jgi:hypothetical protein
MNETIKRQWIDALRSGEYKQGKKKLRSTENQFCCLGVLCDLAAKQGIGKWDACPAGEDRFYFSDEKKPPHPFAKTSSGIEPTDAVCEWAGLENADPIVSENEEDTLSFLNDLGKDFETIAIYIERVL